MIVDQCSLFAVVMCVLFNVDVPLCLLRLWHVIYICEGE